MRLIALIVAVPLALYSWLSPNHYHPWAAFHAQLGAAFSAIIFAGLAVTDRRIADDRWPWLAMAAVLLAAVPWLQFAAGLVSFSGDALLPSLYLLAFAFAQVIGLRLARLHGLGRVAEGLAWLFVVGSLISMFVVLYQWFWLTYLEVYVMELPPPQTRAFGNLAQPNHLALALTFGAVGCAILYELRRVGGAVALLLLALFAFGMVMTQSRAGILLWLALFVWFGMTVHLGDGQGRLTRRGVVAAFGVACAVALAWQPMLAVRIEFTGGTDARTLANMAAPGLRTLHWAAMVDAIGRAPWFGYGWNQVGEAQYLVAPDHPATQEMLADSHNLLLDLMVHNGAVIGVAAASALAWWLVQHLRLARSRVAALALAPALATLLHSMVEFPLNYTFFLLPVGLLMGAVAAAAPRLPAVALPRWSSQILVCVLGLVTLQVAVEYLRLEEDMRSLRYEHHRVGRKVPRLAAEDTRLLTQLSAFMTFADMPRGRSDLTATELEWMRRVAMRYPNWSILTLYAAELARKERPAEAADVLKRICLTQTPADCAEARARWASISYSDTRVAAVAYPPTPQHLLTAPGRTPRR